MTVFNRRLPESLGLVQSPTRRLILCDAKFNLSALSVLYEKKTPSGQMGSSGHLKLKGRVSRLAFQQPSHKAPVLEVLTCKPEIDLNFSSIFSRCEIESVSLTKTAVSSGYIMVFISLFPIVIPLISAYLYIDYSQREGNFFMNCG